MGSEICVPIRVNYKVKCGYCLDREKKEENGAKKKRDMEHGRQGKGEGERKGDRAVK